MENSIFDKIIEFVKNANIDDIEVQTFKYNKNEETILYLVEKINILCYEEKFQIIAIKLYNILLYFLNKNINAETIENYFEYLHYQELIKLL
jgi:hypothetical protein